MAFVEHVSHLIEELIAEFSPLESYGLDLDDETSTSLRIRLPDGKTYIIGPYEPLEQVWVSSPFSGGRHFTLYRGHWQDTRCGADLKQVLQSELAATCNLPKDFFPQG